MMDGNGAELAIRLREALGGTRWFFVTTAAMTALFLVVPIAVILPTSFTGGSFIEFPSSQDLSLRWYGELFSDYIWRDSFLTTLRVSAIAAVIATVLGTAAAVGATRLGRRRAMLDTALTAPLVLPLVTYAVGLYSLMSFWGPTSDFGWPIIIGQSTVSLPLVFVVVSAGLAKLDPELPRAAASLGARWPRVLWQVELPAIKRSILISFIFAFAFCFDEIVIALFLASPGVMTLPVQIYTAAQESVSPAIAAASSLVVVCAMVMAGVVAIASSRRNVKDKETEEP